MAATMLQAAAAYETGDERTHNYIKDDEKSQNETFLGVYIMIFVTVILAINLEKMVKRITSSTRSTASRNGCCL